MPWPDQTAKAGLSVSVSPRHSPWKATGRSPGGAVFPLSIDIATGATVPV